MTVPSGTVTFLFTDIEGSTRLWQQDEAVMRAALERHDAILRTAIEGHVGHVFSTGGDGFGVAFARAGDAVAVAVEAQAALAAEKWPTATPLRVRMALHTGETAERDGDYFGTAVNRAARLMAVAHGGQVVCSAATAGVVGEVALVDLGEHRLRDLDRSMHVFQVGGGTFAPLRSLDALPGNLPLLTSSFVGRHEELAAVAKEVGAHRLVTLSGVGGVGKTRLALQVAADLLPSFADGAWVCELAVAATDDDLAQVVALALGVVQRAQMTVTESIVDFLRPRNLLVVLDNCEHLLDAAAEMAEMILAGAPGVRILATSQEGLGIPGEHLWPLRSLSVAADAAGAAASDAVMLFTDRARSVSPGFVLDEARTPGVVEVCRRLDGIPLAIELAAARVAMMTPGEIAGHLDERFRLLTGGRRGRVKRHQTLHAALEWSYSLLGEADRAVFDRLGVFPASFDQAAAASVCASDGVEPWDVLDALGSLVAKSMVVADVSGDTTRYQLLETLRHFARDHAEDLDGLRRRHAAHFATFAEQAGAGLITRDEMAWRPRVSAELDNLRAAASWAFDAPDLDDLVLGVRVLDGLSPESPTLYATGMYALATSALDRIELLRADQQAVVLNAAAHAAFYGGDYALAETLGATAIADSEAITFAWMGSVFVVSSAALVRGDPERTMAVLADGRRRLDAGGGSDWLDAGLHSLTSVMAHLMGDHETTASEAEQELRIARRVGAPTLVGNALVSRAQGIVDESPTEALAAAEEAMRLVESGAGDQGFSYSRAALIVAKVRAAQGDVSGAARAARAAVAHEARVGNRTLLKTQLLIAASMLATRPEDLEAAAVLTGAAGGEMLGHYDSTLVSRYLRPSDQIVADLATAIDPDRYTNARQRGETMTYDEIVAYTLDQLARLARPGPEPAG